MTLAASGAIAYLWVKLARAAGRIHGSPRIGSRQSILQLVQNSLPDGLDDRLGFGVFSRPLQPRAAHRQ